MADATLKTWTPFFDEIVAGRKRFELRRDDRDFQEGDMLELQEFEPGLGFTGRSCVRYVSYVLRDAAQFGLAEGYVILGIEEGLRSMDDVEVVRDGRHVLLFPIPELAPPSMAIRHRGALVGAWDREAQGWFLSTDSHDLAESTGPFVDQGFAGWMDLPRFLEIGETAHGR